MTGAEMAKQMKILDATKSVREEIMRSGTVQLQIMQFPFPRHYSKESGTE